MKRSLAILPALLLFAAACSGDATAPATMDDAAARPVDAGAYIVVLKEGGSPRLVAAELGVDPKRVYTAVLHGFAATLTEGQVDALRHNPAVAYVEPDRPAQIFTTQLFPVWGLDRIDEPYLPRSNTFTYTANGTGVIIYVLDTGIRKTHVQFGTRADYIANGANGDFVGDGHGSAADCHGHGTHVSGTAAGSSFGVAKAATLRVGRVTNCVGGGDASMAISAMDWIRINGTRPAVVNMSLGYGDMQSVRDAAQALHVAGYVVAAAAGNGNFAGTPQNACLQSPAGNPATLTVGATTSTDDEWSSSNYGTCVDLLAPGASIRSAWVGTDTSTNTISGTSMATPHAAGVAAQYLQLHPAATPSTVITAIKNNTTNGVIDLHFQSAFFGTPNKLLFTNY